MQEVENEEQQLRKLHAVVDSLVNHRKGEPHLNYLSGIHKLGQQSLKRKCAQMFHISLLRMTQCDVFTRAMRKHGSFCQKYGHAGEL